MAGELLTLNGVDGSTGEYLVPPLSVEQISRLAQGERFDPYALEELRWWKRRTTEASLGPREGVDPKNLAEAGWGVVFAHGADPTVKEALRPLLDRRRAQAGTHFRDDLVYRPDESKQKFLARYGAGPGPADPDNVPYYLLIVGDPTAIPFTFQYQLDVQYAVGRISFDSVEDYGAYARGVVDAETGGARRPRRVTLFGTANRGDRATALSSTELVAPLAEQLAKEAAGWEVQPFIGEAATKARLTQTFGSAPAMLFSATHGVGFPDGHQRQLRRQGALLCQDWPGPAGPARPLEECYFSADDLDDLAGDADVAGLIAFHFACYGAGTPALDDFTHRTGGARRQLAPHPLVAGLPKRLLSSGALAVIGHIDRAWTYSFMWDQAGRQTQAYTSCLARLLDDHPIGSAFEYFNERYAELASDLSLELEEIRFAKVPNDLALAGMWMANNDARDFVILGDPAVRLVPAAVVSSPPTREAITLASPQSQTASANPQSQQTADVLKVATYVAKDPSAVVVDEATGQFAGGGAELHAMSLLHPGGDMQLLVAEHVEEPLLQAHLSMVEQALAARARQREHGREATT